MLGPGQQQHVGHHARQPLELLGIGCEDVAVGVRVARPGQGDLGLGQEVADRRSQLVRQVGRELRQTLKIRLQARQHVIQGVGQVRHLDGHGMRRHARVKPVGGDGLGLCLHAPQWRQAGPRRPPAQHAAEQGRQGHIKPEGRLQRLDEVRVMQRVDCHPDTQFVARGDAAWHDRTQYPVFPLAVMHGQRSVLRKLGGACDRQRRKAPGGAGIQRRTRLTVDAHRQIGVILQCVIQPSLQLCRRRGLVDDVLYQVDFVAQRVAIELHEMMVHRCGDDPRHSEQNQRRHQGVADGQACGQ